MSKLYNGGKFNRRNLSIDEEENNQKVTFRYGGVERNFNETIGERYLTVSSESKDNPFLSCPCCSKEFNKNEYPYMGIFTTAPAKEINRYKFVVICKNCAYRIADAVIEADGRKIIIKRKK